MKAKSQLSLIFRATVLIPTCVILAFAQIPSGSLGGTVLDESDAAIHNAKVTVVNKESALQRSVTSGTDGMFLVAGLPPGSYDVRAEAKGFRTLVQTVTVRTGNSSRVELQLPIGVLEQIVEAIDRIPPLDYDKHGIAGVVSRFQIENLPVGGGEKGYHFGGEVVPCPGRLSE